MLPLLTSAAPPDAMAPHTFGGEGLFMMRMLGQGLLLVSSFGALHAIQLAPGQKYIIDTGHLVAFSDGMGFEVRRAARSLQQRRHLGVCGGVVELGFGRLPRRDERAAADRAAR